MQRKYGLLIIFFLILTNCPAQIRLPGQLAFASDRAGYGDIFIMDAWGRLTNLTHSPAGDWSPRWSPDGNQLAYTSHQAGQADIWLLTLQTGQRTNLTKHPAWDYAPAWAPDGQTIVFVSERDGDAELFSQTVGQEKANQLTFNTHQDKLPSWSPKGDKIAFAAVINGMEQIYMLDLNAPDMITPLTYGDLKGTGPVWSPSGDRIAFVGWTENNQINIYCFEIATQKATQLYTMPGWLGSLSWSADETWLFFSGRRANQHELLALNRYTRQVVRLTNNPAWDDFPAPHPKQGFSPIAVNIGDGSVNERPDRLDRLDRPISRPPDRFGYGVNLADLSNTYLIQDIDFNYIKGFVNWATVEPQAGHYRWLDPDNIVHAAEDAQAKILLRIHGTPAWARPEATSLSYPPSDLIHFERFMKAIAGRYRGRVAAYEIWNEPNLDYEWGYRPPNPVEYTALLKSAYRAIKAKDPQALVITAGLAPTGEGNPPQSLGPSVFIKGMYQAGAKGFFDALGSHPYTYGHPPDFESPTEITFDQVAAQRDLMVSYGDTDTPIWITEMGWVLKTHWDLGAYHNQGVSQLEQAAYITRAYEKIETDWPWVEAAFLFNLDFSSAPWYPASEQMRWFAILNPDRTPRPAYTALGHYRRAHYYRENNENRY